MPRLALLLLLPAAAGLGGDGICSQLASALPKEALCCRELA